MRRRRGCSLFELQQNGVPANPIVHPVLRPPQVSGDDLACFRRLVARDLDEARHDCVVLAGAEIGP